MFYLIETKDQLDKLKSKFGPTMYLEFIQGNDNTHPILAEIIAIYLNINNTGYIIPINHLECINWNIDEILDLLKDYNFRVLDKYSDDEKYLMMSEGRPQTMRWLLLQPKK